MSRITCTDGRRRLPGTTLLLALLTAVAVPDLLAQELVSVDTLPLAA
jgi:hypothetical protein